MIISNESPRSAAKPASESYTIKASIVLPPDTNHHGTIFGGKLMAYIDDVATIAATRHARRPVVTASTDSVDFLHPVKKGDAVCLTAFVTWTHKTSMEIFVRVVTEDLLSGERKVCATSFLTFVALGDDGKPTDVPAVIPQTAQERKLYDTAPLRKEARKIRRQESKEFAEVFGTDYRLTRQAKQPGSNVIEFKPQEHKIQEPAAQQPKMSSAMDAFAQSFGVEW